MLYKDIFAKIGECDGISLTYQDSNNLINRQLESLIEYKIFIKDKKQLKKGLDEKFKNKYKGPYSTRMSYDKTLTDLSKYGLSKDDIHEIYYKIDAFFEERKLLIRYFENEIVKSSLIKDFLDKYYLKDNLIKCELLGFEKLRNSQLTLKLYFKLDEECKKIFIDGVINDNIGTFENPEILFKRKNCIPGNKS